MGNSYGGEPPDHQTNHTNSYHRLAMIHANFIIPAKPPRLDKPAKGPLNDPPLGQNFEAIGPVTPADDFQAQFAKGVQPFDPLNQLGYQRHLRHVRQYSEQPVASRSPFCTSRRALLPFHGVAGDKSRWMGERRRNFRPARQRKRPLTP
jgi:hypothetical protein